MNWNKIVSTTVLAALVLALVTACGAEPVRMTEIPVMPGAIPLDRGQNTIIDQMVDAILASSSAEGVAAEVNLYALPAGTAWQDVTGFYDGELAGTEWQPESNLAHDVEFFQTAGWSRGNGPNEQALIVGYVGQDVGPSAYLMVALFSE